MEGACAYEHDAMKERDERHSWRIGKCICSRCVERKELQMCLNGHVQLVTMRRKTDGY